MTYRTENTRTEKCEDYRTLSAALKAAKTMGDPHEVVVVEKNRDGDTVREWNGAGQMLQEDGHYR